METEVGVDGVGDKELGRREDWQGGEIERDRAGGRRAARHADRLPSAEAYFVHAVLEIMTVF
jgi:hypothetical protein